MHFHYWLTVVTGCLETLCFAGIVFGWPSLQFILQVEGYFTYLCNNSFLNEANMSLAGAQLETSCEESQANFNLAYTIAISLLYLVSFPLGYLLDRFGTWFCRIIVSLGFTLGSILLAISTSNSSVLIYPSLALLGISGAGLFFSNVQIANLAKSLRGLILSMLPGTVISSALLFFLVKKGYDAGTDLNLILWMICIATIFIWIRTFVLMPKMHIPYPIPNSTALEYGYKEWKCFKKPSIAEQCVPVSLIAVGASEKMTQKVIEHRNKSNKPEISFRKCLQQPVFWTNSLHTVVTIFRFNFVNGTLQQWLKSIANQNAISKLTDDFGIILLFGAIVSSIDGIIFDAVVKQLQKRTQKMKVVNLKASVVILLLTSFLSIMLSVMVIIRSPYGTFIFQLLTMSFTFGSNSIFIAVNFPPEHVGKLFGVQNVVTALAILLQYGLFELALAVDPSFYYINFGLLVAVILTLVNPLFIYFNIRKLDAGESMPTVDIGLKTAIAYGNIFGIQLNLNKKDKLENETKCS